MADRKKELKKANDAVQAKKNEAPTNAAEAAQNVMNQTTGLGRLKAMQDPNYEVGSYSKSLFGTSSLGGDLLSNVKSDLRKKTAKPVAKF